MRDGKPWLKELKKSGIPTSTAIKYMKLARLASGITTDSNGRQPASEEEKLADTCDVADLSSLVSAGRTFGAIYADPPWQYGNQATRAATDNHICPRSSVRYNMLMDLLTTSEAAAYRGCSISLIRRWCREGRVAGAKRVGRDWAIPREALDSLPAGKPGWPRGRRRKSN